MSILNSSSVEIGVKVVSFLPDTVQEKKITQTLNGYYFVQTIGDEADIGYVSVTATLVQRTSLMSIINDGDYFYIVSEGTTYRSICIAKDIKWNIVSKGAKVNRIYEASFEVSVLSVS